MVLQRRLDYGFSGYQVPVVPRASRSARGRGPTRKKCEDNQIHAFEVLASVAGKLLQDGKSSAPSKAVCGKAQHNVIKNPFKRDQEDGEQFSKADHSKGETCYEMPGLQGHPRHSYTLNEFLHSEDNFSFKDGLASEHFDYSEKIYVDEELAAVNNRIGCGSPSTKVGGDSSCTFQLFEGQVEGIIDRKHEAELLNISSIENVTLPVKGRSEGTMEIDMNPPAWASPKSNLKISLFRDCIALGPVSGDCSELKVISRDDDGNCVGCSQHGTMVKTYKPLSYIGDQRIRNPSVSRHQRVASNLKGGGYFRTDGKIKPIYHFGRSCYSHQRSQKIFPFKKRKIFDQNPLAMSDGEFHCKDIFNSLEKRTNGENFGPATGASSSMAGQEASPGSRGCNVKLSIRSFKVPELLVEIPATATVGSLKRTVMEAVTPVLGDGLHVGILFRGKKVRDDSKTLHQTGICEDDKDSSLGFVLEPRHVQITPPPCTDNPSFPSGGARRGLTRRTTSLKLKPGTSRVESNLGVVPSLVDTSTGNTSLDSRALVPVPVPAISMEALAVVPFNLKSRHPEFGQRRVRRPFSVSEVEALVQAVEKLGTGRWRDVKLLAFDSANHRTYVDLKDKWKTLVHTARISPQQRRGEPVPQELLERVLSAHAYWSQQQAKRQFKAAV